MCCDWGTSFFRLQLIDMSDRRCLSEIQSPVGVAATFDDWQTAGHGLTRVQFFRRQLSRQINTLSAGLPYNLTNVPVVVSGMASSSIGIEEIPYATLPFAVDGRQARIRHFETEPDFPRDMLLVSGVRSQQDVMRGEETQLIGLLAQLDASGVGLNDALCIFPGTHSKHLCVENRQLVRFDTYMTGELFALMANQSILHDSVDLTNLENPTGGNVAAFRRGIDQSTSLMLLRSLFTVRTNQLFGKLTKTENAFYLSGLLIGAELNHLIGLDNGPIVLCSDRKLAVFYELGLNELNVAHRLLKIPIELVNQAASVGQLCLLQHQFIERPNA